MRRLLLLHTNDIHGRVDGLARIATVVERIRAENPHDAVVYVDAGDVEERSNRLSNLTKGAAMHRLLGAAGCRAAAVGNGGLLSYGPDVLAGYRDIAPYPLLLANVRAPGGGLLAGVEASVLLDVDGVRLGVIGVTAPWPDIYGSSFGLELLDPAGIVRELARELRGAGADVVVVLSHLGLREDRELAAALDSNVDAVVGAHSHELLPAGERVGAVLIAQAGEFAQHLGVVELILGDAPTASVVPVSDDVPLHPAVVAEMDRIEPELAAFLAEPIGELAQPLDYATDRECAAASFMADVLRERMQADVGIVTASIAFIDSLPGGPLTRGALYEACDSPAVPAVVEMTGAQLAEIVRRGLDREHATTPIRPFRGRPPGFLHLSGAEIRDGQLLVGGRPLDPARKYRVAGSDWELEPYGDYVERDWNLAVDYGGSATTIMREVVEEHLARVRAPVDRPAPRLHGALQDPPFGG